MIKDILQQRSLDEKMDMWLTDGCPPDVREWADDQKLISEIERRKNLTDQDIKLSLINLGSKILKRLENKTQ